MIIKLTFLLLALVMGKANAQCNVQVNQRDDGVTVRYLRPDRIGFTDKLMLALSMQTNGEQFFVSTLSVFQTSAVKLKGNLTLKFTNNKSSTLKHFHSEITTFNGLPATVSIFIADANCLNNISNSNVKMTMVQLSNNIFQTISVKMNEDILMKHYECLK